MTKNKKANHQERRNRVAHDLVRLFFGSAILTTAPPKYYFEQGAPRNRRFHGRAVITSNHLSFHDGILVSVAWIKHRIHILTTKEAFEKPFLRWFLPRTQSLMVDRSTTDIKSVRNVVNTLKQDKMVVIFPEGHINGDDIGELQNGAAFFAQATNAPIIPMYLTDKLRPFRRTAIYIGKPLEVSQMLEHAQQAGQKKLAYISQKIKESLIRLKYRYYDDFLKKHTKHQRWDLRAPKRGDQIRVDCGNYYHYGIYLDESTIVQFGTRDISRNPESVVVNVTDAISFIRDGYLEVRKRSLFCNRRSIVEKIALSKLGNGGYDLIHNNCEHFSYFCAFGPYLPKN